MTSNCNEAAAASSPHEDLELDFDAGLRFIRRELVECFALGGPEKQGGAKGLVDFGITGVAAGHEVGAEDAAIATEDDPDNGIARIRGLLHQGAEVGPCRADFQASRGLGGAVESDFGRFNERSGLGIAIGGDADAVAGGATVGARGLRAAFADWFWNQLALRREHKGPWVARCDDSVFGSGFGSGFGGELGAGLGWRWARFAEPCVVRWGQWRKILRLIGLRRDEQGFEGIGKFARGEREAGRGRLNGGVLRGVRDPRRERDRGLVGLRGLSGGSDGLKWQRWPRRRLGCWWGRGLWRVGGGGRRGLRGGLGGILRGVARLGVRSGFAGHAWSAREARLLDAAFGCLELSLLADSKPGFGFGVGGVGRAEPDPIALSLSDWWGWGGWWLGWRGFGSGGWCGGRDGVGLWLAKRVDV